MRGEGGLVAVLRGVLLRGAVGVEPLLGRSEGLGAILGPVFPLLLPLPHRVRVRAPVPVVVGDLLSVAGGVLLIP